MRRLLSILVLVLLPCTVAFAQSSGNFAAEINTTACTMDADGVLSGGIGFGNFPWSTEIKVPNGSGTSLVIRPSFATGLYTKSKLESGGPNASTATVSAGVQVCVKIDEGKLNGITGPNAEHCVIYDKRFQQLKTNLFSSLLTDCDPVAVGIQPCYLQLVLSTLSAHSFDFVAHDIPGGTRTVTVDVNLVDVNTSGGDAAACVGPGVVTVTQTKVFSTSDGIVVNP